MGYRPFNAWGIVDNTWGIGYNESMKKEHLITLEETTWQQLEDIARDKKLMYRGRLSRAAVIEKLVAAYMKKKEQPVDNKAQTQTVEDTTLAVQNHRPVRAVPKPDKK
jgi:hypothetical protein